MYGEALSHLQAGQVEKAQNLFRTILEDPISVKAQVRQPCEVICFADYKLYETDEVRKKNPATMSFDPMQFGHLL